MIQISASMRILVAIEPVDLRKGIDGLAQLCREKLSADPISGCLFIFRSRRGTTIKALAYDGQGYWLAQKRLSQGRFRWWPEASEPAKLLEAYEAQLLLAAGDVSRVRAAPMWRPVNREKKPVNKIPTPCVPEKRSSYCGGWRNSSIGAGRSPPTTSFL